MTFIATSLSLLIQLIYLYYLNNVRRGDFVPTIEPVIGDVKFGSLTSPDRVASIFIGLSKGVGEHD